MNKENKKLFFFYTLPYTWIPDEVTSHSTSRMHSSFTITHYCTVFALLHCIRHFSKNLLTLDHMHRIQKDPVSVQHTALKLHTLLYKNKQRGRCEASISWFVSCFYVLFPCVAFLFSVLIFIILLFVYSSVYFLAIYLLAFLFYVHIVFF